MYSCPLGIVTGTRVRTAFFLGRFGLLDLDELFNIGNELTRPEEHVDGDGDEERQGIESVEEGFGRGEMAEVTLAELNGTIYRTDLSCQCRK